MLFLVLKLIELTCMTTTVYFAYRSTRRILQFYLLRVENILRYIGLHVSSSVAHFVWKMKQIEFHLFFTVCDIKATAEKHISRTWKGQFTLRFWGLNNQYVERSENNCNWREKKSFKNKLRLPCLSSSGVYQRGRCIITCHCVVFEWYILLNNSSTENLASLRLWQVIYLFLLLQDAI